MQPEEDLQRKSPPKDPLGRLISENTHYSKNKDDLLDIHIGNPLRKITELLEDIKKQKAFSFTLKGSLGIAGVVLALSVLGILGAGNLLCEKGVQTKTGNLKILNIKETVLENDLPLISLWINYFSPKQTHNRTIIISPDNSVTKLSYSRFVNFSQYENLPVLVTGNYDACSQTITIQDTNGIETYLKNAP